MRLKYLSMLCINMALLLATVHGGTLFSSDDSPIENIIEDVKSCKDC